MGFQPVPNVASVELIYWNGKSYAENVLHYESATAWGVGKETDLAALIRQWYVDEMKTLQPATLFLNKIIIKDLTTQNGPAIEYNAGMPLPGDNTGDIAPMNVTVAVKLVTGLRGRSYRGRLYHVGLTKTGVSGDAIAGGTATWLKEAYEALLEVKADVADPGWCVVSRWQNLLPRAEGVATPIISVEVEGTVDSQRRRLLGRGS